LFYNSRLAAAVSAELGHVRGWSSLVTGGSEGATLASEITDGPLWSTGSEGATLASEIVRRPPLVHGGSHPVDHAL